MIKSIARVSSLLLLVGMWQSNVAQAQPSIGSAVAVENQVEGKIGRTLESIETNSRIYADETIKSYPKSSAKFVLADKTKLSVGPSSQIKIDRFVYTPGSSSNEIVFNAMHGAFRFVTGIAGHKSYRVVTASASIGVRGTDFDVYTTSKETLLLARKGTSYMCPGGSQGGKLNPDDEACCKMNAGPAAGPLYGIMQNGNKKCDGPYKWDGTNPGRLINDPYKKDWSGINTHQTLKRFGGSDNNNDDNDDNDSDNERSRKAGD
jgi:hypothetical protein